MVRLLFPCKRCLSNPRLSFHSDEYCFSYCREATTPSGSLDNTSQKTKLLASVAMLAKKNPALKDILSFPKMAKSRLLTLMKQT